MRKRGRAGFLILAIAALCSLSSCDNLFGPSFTLVPEEIEREIFDLVNAHRQGIGKPFLVLNEMISLEARQHSKDMADKKVPFGHDGFNERVGRIKQIIPWSAAAEVVAAAGNAKEAVDVWLASAEHRAKLEGDFDLTGVGVAVEKSGWTLYATMIFIRTK